MNYCAYCGYGYIKSNCILCNDSIYICGCDPSRQVCEKHYCVCCQEPFLDLNDSGECKECEYNRLDTEHYHSLDILGVI